MSKKYKINESRSHYEERGTSHVVISNYQKLSIVNVLIYKVRFFIQRDHHARKLARGDRSPLTILNALMVKKSKRYVE